MRDECLSADLQCKCPHFAFNTSLKTNSLYISTLRPLNDLYDRSTSIPPLRRGPRITYPTLPQHSWLPISQCQRTTGATSSRIPSHARSVRSPLPGSSFDQSICAIEQTVIHWKRAEDVLTCGRGLEQDVVRPPRN